MADFKRSNLPTRPGLSEEEVEDLFEAFQLFDADGGGTINKEVRLVVCRSRALYVCVSRLSTNYQPPTTDIYTYSPVLIYTHHARS
jgi:hypothetical protein